MQKSAWRSDNISEQPIAEVAQSSASRSLDPSARLSSGPGFGHSISRIPVMAPTGTMKGATMQQAQINPLSSIRPPIQAKLSISQPGDALEQEADRVAEKVMSMPLSPPPHEGAPLTQMQRSSAQAISPPVPLIVGGVLRSPGAPLDAATRAFMEPRFGFDFSKVKVHTDAKAMESALRLNASAYCVGLDIAFASGHYAPWADKGQHLLAHELTHVIQQQNSSVSDIASINTSKHENGSDRIAEDMTSNRRIHSPGVTTEAIIARSGPGINKEGEFLILWPSQAQAKAAVGTNGMFPENSPTEALRRWDYVVYGDHVRLGNRKISEGVVIGSWPWLTNNPGDITVDTGPRKENDNDPSSYYWQDMRAWGRPRQRGPRPDKLSPLQDDSGLSADNTAVQGFAARRDLAIFADLGRGQRALKEWILKYYGDVTLKESVNIHLGTKKTHKQGIDDPDQYWKRLQQYLSSKNYPKDYVINTICKNVKPAEWNDVVDAFGFVEGFYNLREITGQKGKFHYVENKGIVYRCTGRDPIEVDSAFRDLSLVTKMPQNTPPEISNLLGCVVPIADASSSVAGQQKQIADQRDQSLDPSSGLT